MAGELQRRYGGFHAFSARFHGHIGANNNKSIAYRTFQRYHHDSKVDGWRDERIDDILERVTFQPNPRDMRTAWTTICYS